MTLQEMINRRKSTRSHTGEAADPALLQQILDRAASLHPLDPSIRTAALLLDKSQVHCLQPWKTPHYLAVYSEEKEGYLENAGFLYQQLDLFIQSLGLGCCWVGLGTPADSVIPPEGMKFVILLIFGPTAESPLRDGAADFQRRSLADVSDREDPRLEPARLAPSAMNSQPWYFLHDGDVIHAYCVIHNRLKQRTLGRANRIDMGIALGQLYVSCPERFQAFRAENPPARHGYSYVRSFRL